MDATTRRKQILDTISRADTPTTAIALATQLGVSRQVIVGDIALLRAGGHEITATARGYVADQKPTDGHQYKGTVASRHASKDTKAELYQIVDLGGIVLDVTVDHEIYGNITGSLNIKSREDVDKFINRLKSSQDKLLLELSKHGEHRHTIVCRDKDHFDSIVQALSRDGFIHYEFPY